MSEWNPNADTARGAPRDFRTPRWSVVVQAGDSQLPAAAASLEQLCRAYWYPLYAYARSKLRDPEAARDATQDFFAELLARKSLLAADPEKGRFRAFLLTVFQRHLIDDWRRARAEKRGGRAEVFHSTPRPPRNVMRSNPPTRPHPNTSTNAPWPALCSTARSPGWRSNTAGTPLERTTCAPSSPTRGATRHRRRPPPAPASRSTPSSPSPAAPAAAGANWCARKSRNWGRPGGN